MKSSFLLILALILSGCASTHITSFTDPAYKNKKLSKILIFIDETVLQDRLELEEKFVKLFAEHNILAIESYRLFPPTRNLTEDIMRDSILANNIDVYLIASVKQTGIETVNLPTKIVTTTKGNISSFGNDSKIKLKTESEEIGGGQLSKPWANVYAKIVDAANGNTIWISEAFSGGSAYSSFNTVFDSYCEEVIRKLFEDRLLESGAYDIIYLKDGRMVIGEILKESERSILFKTNNRFGGHETKLGIEYFFKNIDSIVKKRNN